MIFNRNYLGHEFTNKYNSTMWFICKLCNITVGFFPIYSIERHENIETYNFYNTNNLKYISKHLTCSEFIIKNIIE